MVKQFSLQDCFRPENGWRQSFLFVRGENGGGRSGIKKSGKKEKEKSLPENFSQLSHNFVKMAYFYKIMCVKKSAFKKVILSDFFKNTSLSCFGQPSGERQTHFAFFSPLSPSLFPFVQSNSFVMRQFLFPLYAPAFIRAKNALILSRLTARCWLIRSQFLVSVRKAIALRFIRTSTARSAATASPGNRTNLFFP